MNSKLKYLVFFLCLIPLLHLTWLAAISDLGANPVESIIHSLGIWTLVMLLITLSMTPLRLVTGAVLPLKFRRMFGLFTFFYASLHFLAYAGLDQWFDLGVIAKDISKHPYILVGFGAYVLLVPLASTSTNAMIKRLGRHWKTLHRLVYVIGILAIIHFWWLVKKDVTEPLIYGAVFGSLLSVRIVHHFRKVEWGKGWYWPLRAPVGK